VVSTKRLRYHTLLGTICECNKWIDTCSFKHQTQKKIMFHPKEQQQFLHWWYSWVNSQVRDIYLDIFQSNLIKYCTIKAVSVCNMSHVTSLLERCPNVKWSVLSFRDVALGRQFEVGLHVCNVWVVLQQATCSRFCCIRYKYLPHLKQQNKYNKIHLLGDEMCQLSTQ